MKMIGLILALLLGATYAVTPSYAADKKATTNSCGTYKYHKSGKCTDARNDVPSKNMTQKLYGK
jgi:hypothetical protein